ncbi:MAG: hypothetical protein ACYC6L_02285 [Anaerolineae bacterium]
MVAHLVSAIDTRDFGAETVRIGDLNGDGAPDLLFVQSLYGSREITCLTAVTIHGEILWQVGTPSAANGAIYSDLPVQIYDWDGDGVNEVLYIRQAVYAEHNAYPYNGHMIRERATRYEGAATMAVLNAQDGREKGSFAIPAPADDSFAFADLTGRGRREDLVVKDRYWNVWGIAHNGDVLWQWTGSVGHYPAIADIDGDGCDEIFQGYSLLDQDGRPIFEHDAGDQHQDAAYLAQHTDGSWRLLFGNGGIHCLDVSGKTLWEHPLREAQHVVAGHFLGNAENQFAVIDRGDRSKAASTAMVYLYDLAGHELWRREEPSGSWAAAIVPVRWSGGAGSEILVYGRGESQPAAILNGAGDIVDLLPLVLAERLPSEQYGKSFYGNRADVWGDSREEVILFGEQGCCIWANARPLSSATL